MNDVGLSTTLKPRLVPAHQLNKRKKFKRYEIRVPGLGRIGFTRDPGEAKIFQTPTFETRLGLVVRESLHGPILDERDLGSGLVTNVGALALCLDGVTNGVAKNALPAKSKEPYNLFAQLRWHQWGTGTTEAQTDIKLIAAATNKTTGNANKAVEAINTLTPVGTGEPKLVSTAKIEAESGLAITEWGIFTQQLLEASTGSPLTLQTTTTGTTTGAALTASSEEIKGETLKVLVTDKNEASEEKPVWGLIRSNTTSVVTVPAWYSEATGAVAEPLKTGAYKIRPVMFDHRKFTVINVVSGNIIEFPWDLTIKAGG